MASGGPQQRTATPDHGKFYALAGELVDMSFRERQADASQAAAPARGAA